MRFYHRSKGKLVETTKVLLYHILEEREGNKIKNSSSPTRWSLRNFGFIANLLQAKALHRIILYNIYIIYYLLYTNKLVVGLGRFSLSGLEIRLSERGLVKVVNMQIVRTPLLWSYISQTREVHHGLFYNPDLSPLLQFRASELRAAM